MRIKLIVAAAAIAALATPALAAEFYIVQDSGTKSAGDDISFRATGFFMNGRYRGCARIDIAAPGRSLRRTGALGRRGRRERA
jgi:hypothetical protein